MTFTIRPITENERPEFRRLMGLAFGFDPTDEGTESFNATLEIERPICACDGEQMIGTAGAYSLDMTVPGGAAPVAGTTMVSVLATHRRQGALRLMMRAHLDEARNHGDALAGLWASESSIYGRFGLEAAATMVEAEIDRSHAGFRGSPLGSGAVRLVELDEAKRLLPPRVRPDPPSATRDVRSIRDELGIPRIQGPGKPARRRYQLPVRRLRREGCPARVCAIPRQRAMGRRWLPQ